MDTSARASRILLVDDNHDNLMLLRLFLEEAGYHVTTAGNGQEAVRLFEKEACDLVLMDLAMPVMDGREATLLMREVEHRDKRRPVPIVILTAHDLDEYRHSCLDAGCTAFLLKPLRQPALLEQMRLFLDGPADPPTPNQPRTSDDTGPDMAFLRPVLPIFFAAAEASLNQCREALGRGDTKTVALLGHRIKGSSFTYGFMALGEAGARLEQAGRADDTDAAYEAHAKACHLLREARKVLD